MKKTRPMSARAVSGEISGFGNRAWVMCAWKNVGPSRIPAKISPSTGGCPRRLAMMPSSLARMMMIATSAKSNWTALRLMVRPPSPPGNSPVTMRVVPERVGVAQPDLRARDQGSSDVRRQLRARGLAGEDEERAVGGIEVGDEDIPAVQFHAGVDPGHQIGGAAEPQGPGAAFGHRLVQGGLPPHHVIGIERSEEHTSEL